LLKTIARWVIAAGIIWFGITFIYGFFEGFTNSIHRQTAGPDQGTPSKAEAAALPKIGDTIQTGYWTYKIDGFHWAPFITSYGTAERPDAQFLILDLSAQNNDRTASTLPPVKLLNDKGQEFSQSSSGALSDGFFSPLKELNPGVGSRGLIAFDVPPGTYKVKLSGGFEAGETAVASLDMPEVASTPEKSSISREDLERQVAKLPRDASLPLDIWQKAYILANRQEGTADDDLVSKANDSFKEMNGLQGDVFNRNVHENPQSPSARTVALLAEVINSRPQQSRETEPANGKSGVRAADHHHKIPEDVWVHAYVQANRGRAGNDDDKQLENVARGFYYVTQDDHELAGVGLEDDSVKRTFELMQEAGNQVKAIGGPTAPLPQIPAKMNNGSRPEVVRDGTVMPDEEAR
jgi:hypothetical protein